MNYGPTFTVEGCATPWSIPKDYPLVSNKNMELCLYMRAQGPNAQCSTAHGYTSTHDTMIANHKNSIEQIIRWNMIS